MIAELSSTPKSTTCNAVHVNHPTLEEIAKPQLVIDRLFANTHLPALREGLWQWLKLSDTGTYNPLERANLVYLYEEMERLVEAVWVMRGGVRNPNYEIASFWASIHRQAFLHGHFHELPGRKSGIIEAEICHAAEVNPATTILIYLVH